MRLFGIVWGGYFTTLLLLWAVLDWYYLLPISLILFPVSYWVVRLYSEFVAIHDDRKGQG